VQTHLLSELSTHGMPAITKLFVSSGPTTSTNSGLQKDSLSALVRLCNHIRSTIIATSATSSEVRRHTSSAVPCTSGVPQGSVLGAIFCSLSTLHQAATSTMVSANTIITLLYGKIWSIRKISTDGEQEDERKILAAEVSSIIRHICRLKQRRQRDGNEDIGKQSRDQRRN